MSHSFDLIKKIRQQVEKVNHCIEKDLQLLGESMEPFLCEILEYGLLGGGKRVRPLLVVMAAGMCGSKNERSYELGMAFEYLHAATLFHDDIIDNADCRRGRESVANKFGNGSAILAGDFLHARSMYLVGDIAGQKGLTSFCNATSGMVEGEFLQLRNAAEYNLSELDYYKAIMGKTGLLISSACEVGAIYGGGNEEQIKALSFYGEKLGSAFQIIDDLLDYLGDTAKTGKAVGNDLVEGKITLPLILALAVAGDQDKLRIQKIIEDDKLRESQFEEVTDFIHKYDGFEKAFHYAEQDVLEACKQLELFDETVQEEKDFLTGLAKYVLARNV